MMTDYLSSKILKQISREQLLGKYPVAILSYFLMQIIAFLVLNFASSASLSVGGLIVYYAICFIVLLINAIFKVGQDYFYLHITRENTCSLSDMWYGFKNFPDKAIGIQFVFLVLYIAFGIPFSVLLYLLLSANRRLYLIPCLLGFLFFLAATIMVRLLFSQAFYLLIDEPSTSCRELLRQSAQMMNGYKVRLFYINISFIGMYLLVIVTMGLGILWVYPYVSMVRANFYQNLKGELNKKSEPV